MNETAFGLHEILKTTYDKLNELSPDTAPYVNVMNTIAAFVSQSFPESNHAQLVSAICWLIIANKYPNCAGWLMESMDPQLISIVEQLCEAINEVYLEVR